MNHWIVLINGLFSGMFTSPQSITFSPIKLNTAIQCETPNRWWLVSTLHILYDLLVQYFLFLQDPHFNLISDNILIAAIKLHDNRHQFAKKSCMLGFNYTILTFLKEYLKNKKTLKTKDFFKYFTQFPFFIFSIESRSGKFNFSPPANRASLERYLEANWSIDKK